MSNKWILWPLFSLLMAGCTASLASTPTSIPEPTPQPEPTVRIHYLGHASFFFEFDNGLTVLTDYGQSNAFGLDSPIYDLVGIVPDIVTFSHAHPDHHRPGVTFDESQVLNGTESLSLDGLEITPIRTSEASIFAPDNSSYLFTYKGLKILHLADAQAYITQIDQPAVREQVKQLYPDRYDLLLMTIQGVTEFIPQAETFVNLLQPLRVIPMHYWSPAYKADFLAYLETQNQQAGKHYVIQEIGGPNYELFAGETVEPIRVNSLEPAGMSQTK